MSYTNLELKPDLLTAISEGLFFEKAAELRDQITALSKTLEKQVVASANLKDQDVFGYCRQGTSIAIAILFVREGLITGSRNFFLSEPMETDTAILSQTLNLFYDEKATPAKEILIPFAAEDAELLAERFSELLGGVVNLNVPKRGDRVQLLQMAMQKLAK